MGFDMELYGLEVVDEKREYRSSDMLLMVEKEIKCLLVGDPDADKLGGDPGGVNRGVLLWDTNNTPGEMCVLEDDKRKEEETKCKFPNLPLAMENFYVGHRLSQVHSNGNDLCNFNDNLEQREKSLQ
ncbi:hypothetical protein L2E82_44314 [Cichorium intybus]|uniref:Uncharacterized protein n=1 Tax=Cichorium intybus TaxID=13427 RepID=A0ACB8ZRD9_CICIN|nr:hypothetical protein L2E82_44314 [Cichorium intybus]